jgi:hypothetical protein
MLRFRKGKIATIKLPMLGFLIAFFCVFTRSQPANDECLRSGLAQFIPAHGGKPIEGNFVLLEFSVPPVLPAAAEIPVKVSFFRTRADTVLNLSAAIIGEWNKSAVWPLAIIRKLKAADTVACVAAIKTPATPGQYRVRLVLRQLGPKQRDLPFSFTSLCDKCAWSELVVNIIDENWRPTNSMSQSERAQPQQTANPDRSAVPEQTVAPQLPLSPDPRGSREEQKAMLDSERDRGDIDEASYKERETQKSGILKSQHFPY